MDDEDDEYFTKSISVGIMQSNSLEKANNVNIISFEKKPGSLFTSPYVVYHIVVEPLNTEVGRRFNDFFWLRETLEKLFPGVLIPPIPKKTQSRSMLDIFVNKRMSVLNVFLIITRDF